MVTVLEVSKICSTRKPSRLRFLEYSGNQNGWLPLYSRYRGLDGFTGLILEKEKVVIRRDVTFNEDDLGHQKLQVEMEPEAEEEARKAPGKLEDPVEGDAHQEEPRWFQRSTEG